MGDSGISSVDVNGWHVESNSSTKEQLRDALVPKDQQEEEKSKAASELGKAGGKASAEKRAAEKAEEEKAEKKPIKPIPPKKEANADDKSSAAVSPDADKGKESKAASPDEEENGGEEKAAESDKSEEKPDTKKGNPRHDPIARMQEATRKEAEAKRQLREAMSRAEDLERRLSALERGERPQPREEARQVSDGRPKIEEFDDLDAYLEARDKWRDGQNQTRAQERAIEEALVGQWQKFRQQFAEVDASQISPEVLEIRTSFQMEPGQQETGANWIANELFFSPERAPALMLYLSEHPDDFQRIAALSTPRAVSREMAKLEARLDVATPQNAGTDATPEEREVSKAHPPVKPVSGLSHAVDAGEYRPGMTLDQYAPLWKRQQNRR